MVSIWDGAYTVRKTNTIEILTNKLNYRWYEDVGGAIIAGVRIACRQRERKECAKNKPQLS
jgi:hypothetical protein